MTGETASGWQTRTLSTPVALTAGTAYVVSYTSPTGRVSQTSELLHERVLHAGSAHRDACPERSLPLHHGGFPDSVATGTNYFVDPVFQYLGP